MSNVILVSDMVAEAALEIGDQDYTRIGLSDWVLIYNKALRETCERFQVNEREYQQDLIADTHRYAYPNLMTKVRVIKASYTPTDENTFYDLKEMTDDEFRETTRRRYSIATAPTHYFARRDSFEVWPKPTDTLQGALILICFSLPDRITQIESTLFELPDPASGLVVERMVIQALKALDRYEEADNRYRAWMEEGMRVEDVIEDRTDDRRQSLQPKSFRNPLSGMA